MKIKFEGKKDEIEKFKNIIQACLQSQGVQIKSFSNFYPNFGNEFLEHSSSIMGRIYVELTD
jgi:hypothetical protein